MFRRLLPLAAALTLSAGAAHGQTLVGSAFTYQGQLAVSGQPASGNFDFEFKLFNAASGGTQVGQTVLRPNISTAQGLFTTPLDFGAGAMNGSARWLEIAVKPAGQAVAYTTLAPRQRLTPAPYAAGLALPFAGEQGASGPLFSLENTGNGNALNATAAYAGTAVYAQANYGTAVHGYHLGSGGSAAIFRTENINNASDAVHIEGNGTGSALFATSSKGTAGEFVITNPVNNQSVISAITAGTGRAGTFQNTNENSGITTLFATSNGDSNTFAAVSTGFGRAALIQASNFASSAETARIENTGGSGDALVVKKTSNTIGDAIQVEAADPSAVALNVAAGGVRCAGAGLNTNTWVFRHRMAAGEPGGYNSIINNPMCNGRPNAILIVTPYSSVATATPNSVYAWYNDALSRWVVSPTAPTFTFHTQGLQEWSVMVILP